jgi:hypothetical protein
MVPMLALGCSLSTPSAAYFLACHPPGATADLVLALLFQGRVGQMATHAPFCFGQLTGNVTLT